MNHCTRLTVAAILVLCSITVGHAIPQLINYQGILTDGGGTPITVATSVEFRIWDMSAGGDQQWTETQSITPDATGRFNVLLGSVNPIPDAALDQAEAWLGMTVSPDPEMTPRTLLVAVAYAFRPGTVDGATGGTISGQLTLSGGNLTLDASTATEGNIIKSGARFIHDFGLNNTFIGGGAGNLTMSGSDNAANGFFALRSNTTGTNNTATGSKALWNNTTGVSNTANGASALVSNISGLSNTACGAFALFSNTTGLQNSALGAGALFQNTEGFNNTASGANSLNSNTTGDGNTANGFFALWANTTGNANTATGYSALSNSTSSSNNTASGAFALQENKTGSNNSAFGFQAMFNDTSGSNNTASGFRALFNSTSANNNTAVGNQALQGNSTGFYNTASGASALITNTTGSNNSAFGSLADVSADNLNNATAIGFGAIVDASDKIRLGNADVTVIEGQVAFTFTSDKNQKENFRPVDGDKILKGIRDLNLTTWNYRGQDPKRFRHYGPVAQEFFAAFGQDGVGNSGTPTTINSGDMAGILMIAIQALDNRNKELEATVADLKCRLEQLAVR